LATLLRAFDFLGFLVGDAVPRLKRAFAEARSLARALAFGAVVLFAAADEDPFFLGAACR
jgi:hypothetical protein